MTKKNEDNYLEINRDSWNKRTETHYKSTFYGVEDFVAGKSSLKDIELDLLGDISGKKVLHLQCHFGQDTISLSRMGAQCVGVDFSDAAIAKARQLAQETSSATRFICTDIYSLPEYLDEQFDLVFTSYGTIGWLPDLEKWAKVIAHFLKPGGQFIMADFHPVLWMLDDEFTHFKYSYFNEGQIEEDETSTYAEKEMALNIKTISWNHPISDILSSLLKQELSLQSFQEFDYSPYNCFDKTKEVEAGRYSIEHLGRKLPMVYALKAHYKK